MSANAASSACRLPWMSARIASRISVPRSPARLRRAAGHRGRLGRWHAASGSLREAIRVLVDGIDVRQSVPHGVGQRAQYRIGQIRDPVVNPEAFAPPFDEPRLAEVRKMTRRLGLRNLQALVDVADADL